MINQCRKPRAPWSSSTTKTIGSVAVIILHPKPGIKLPEKRNKLGISLKMLGGFPMKALDISINGRFIYEYPYQYCGNLGAKRGAKRNA
jgi:hypothetical protein